jgi:hypothetical protein
MQMPSAERRFRRSFAQGQLQVRKSAVILNPSFSHASTARSYHAVMTGSFDAAKNYLQTAHWSMRLTPDFWLARLVLAASLHATDNFEPAATVANDLKRDYPGLNADEFVSWFPYADPHEGDGIRRALVQSGWR